MTRAAVSSSASHSTVARRKSGLIVTSRTEIGRPLRSRTTPDVNASCSDQWIFCAIWSARRDAVRSIMTVARGDLARSRVAKASYPTPGSPWYSQHD